MLLPGFGAEGQARLKGSCVLLLGCGALGTVAADMLARAGVGHLVIVDRDYVELTNLQRQVLFDERDVARAMPKAEAAREKLANINSAVRVTAVVDDINHQNIERYAAGADVLVDGLDNFETRYLANDVAVKTGRPYVYGAAVGSNGMAFTVLPHSDGTAEWERGDNLASPCFRCLFDEAPAPGTSPTCDTAGVLGSVVATIANLQAVETLKILTGNFDQVNRKLLNIDLWSNDLMQLDVSGARDKGGCPCCVDRRFDYLDGKLGSSATALCGRNAVQLRHRQRLEAPNLKALAGRLGEVGSVTANEFLLRAEIREADKTLEITLFADGRAIIKGTDDAATARAIYSRYVGA